MKKSRHNRAIVRKVLIGAALCGLISLQACVAVKAPIKAAKIGVKTSTKVVTKTGKVIIPGD